MAKFKTRLYAQKNVNEKVLKRQLNPNFSNILKKFLFFQILDFLSVKFVKN